MGFRSATTNIAANVAKPSAITTTILSAKVAEARGIGNTQEVTD